MKTFEELVAQNEKDKKALDLIKIYRDYVKNYQEILDDMEKGAVPVNEDTYTQLDSQKEAFRELWLIVADEIDRNVLSFDVWALFVRLRHDVKFKD